jgi:hypothetical protein
VLEAGQRVLLGVQHLLGGLLHVPMRLLGEHPAAAGPVQTAESGGMGGEEVSPSGSFTPQPCGPGHSRLLPAAGQGRHLHPPRAAVLRNLAPVPIWRIPSPGSAPSEGAAGRPPPPQAGARTQSRGGGALGTTHNFALPQAPLR